MTKYKTYLPSKKFTTIIIILLIVGIAVWLYMRYQKKVIVKNEEVIHTTVQELVTQDSDKDGIPDWEEALWGTDAASADTDKDGTSDKAEIDERKRQVAIKTGASLDEQIEMNDNETEAFAKEIFATVISLKEAGALTEQSINDLAEKIGQNAALQKDIEDKYTLADMKTGGTNATFAKSFDKTLETYLKKGIGTELVVLETSIDQTNEGKAKELETIGKAYLDLAEAVKKIEVPQATAKLALDFANASYKTGVAVSNMTHFYDNPLVGLVGLAQYERYGDTPGDALEKLQTYFINE